MQQWKRRLRLCLYCLGTCNILVTLLHKVKCISMLLQELTPLVCDTVFVSFFSIGDINEQTCSANWGQGQCLWLTGDMSIRLFSDGTQQASITAASSVICMWSHICPCHAANDRHCAMLIKVLSDFMVECQKATVVINERWNRTTKVYLEILTTWVAVILWPIGFFISMSWFFHHKTSIGGQRLFFIP